MTGMDRHRGGAAARPSDCDSRTTHKQTHLRSSAHSAADSREERPHMRPPARGARRGASAPHLPFPRPSPPRPFGLATAMASWPPVCSLGRSRNCSHVRSNKRGEAMPYGRRAARGMGGVTRLGLHGRRRGAGRGRARPWPPATVRRVCGSRPPGPAGMFHVI
jgi:hypothetical protein